MIIQKMARTSFESSSSVNFRMPNSILKDIDELAHKNNHERTAEINGACRHWIEIGGVSATDITTHNKIDKLEKNIESLEKQIDNSNKQISELKQEIISLSEQLKNERALLLKIIDSNEETIKKILNRD